jgi:hypothetical protein
MEYLLLAPFLTALFHNVYDSDFAPEMRGKLKSRLRRLLAELRAVERAHPAHADRQCIRDLRGSLENLLESLDRFGVVVLWLIGRESRGNPDGKRLVDARMARLGRCDIPEVRDIRARSVRIAMRAIAVNNGGLLLYTWPALVAFAWPSVRKRFSRFAMQAIDFHQQFGAAYVRVKHDVLSL